MDAEAALWVGFRLDSAFWDPGFRSFLKSHSSSVPAVPPAWGVLAKKSAPVSLTLWTRVARGQTAAKSGRASKKQLPLIVFVKVILMKRPTVLPPPVRGFAFRGLGYSRPAAVREAHGPLEHQPHPVSHPLSLASRPFTTWAFYHITRRRVRTGYFEREKRRSHGMCYICPVLLLAVVNLLRLVDKSDFIVGS